MKPETRPPADTQQMSHEMLALSRSAGVSSSALLHATNSARNTSLAGRLASPQVRAAKPSSINRAERPR
jgi:hypothetical protein